MHFMDTYDWPHVQCMPIESFEKKIDDISLNEGNLESRSTSGEKLRADIYASVAWMVQPV